MACNRLLASQGGNAGFPDYHKGFAVGRSFVAPMDGWCYISTNGRWVTFVDGAEVKQSTFNDDQVMGVLFPVSKGQYVHTEQEKYSGTFNFSVFYPCK